jgi:hypothetical protein
VFREGGSVEKTIASVADPVSYSDPLSLKADADDAVVAARNLSNLLATADQIPHSWRLGEAGHAVMAAMGKCARDLDAAVAAAVDGAGGADVEGKASTARQSCSAYRASMAALVSLLARYGFHLAKPPASSAPPDPAEFAASLEALASSMPLQMLTLLTWSLDPPPLARRGDVTVVAATSNLGVAVVVKNAGRVPVKDGSCSVSVSGGGSDQVARRQVFLPAQGSVYFVAKFSVAEGVRYQLAISCSRPGAPADFSVGSAIQVA